MVELEYVDFFFEVIECKFLIDSFEKRVYWYLYVSGNVIGIGLFNFDFCWKEIRKNLNWVFDIFYARLFKNRIS